MASLDDGDGKRVIDTSPMGGVCGEEKRWERSNGCIHPQTLPFALTNRRRRGSEQSELELSSLGEPGQTWFADGMTHFEK